MKRLTVIAQFFFVQDATLALSGYVCDPDVVDGLTSVFHHLIQFVPKWLIEFLSESKSALWTTTLVNVQTLGKAFAWAPIIVTAPG